MLLQRLAEYSRRGEHVPFMYVPTPIRWIIELDRNGQFLGTVQLEGEGKRGKRGQEFLAPHVSRSVNLAAKLLADRADYVLGVVDPEKSESRTVSMHDLFVTLVRDCSRAVQLPEIEAVSTFLATLDGTRRKVTEDIKAADIVTFRVDGVLLINLPEVQAYWAGRFRSSKQDSDATECLICSQRRPSARRHPAKLKGIPGAQSSGAALVSANSPVFESYGLEESHIVPVCTECAEAYAKGANSLLQDPSKRLHVGSIVYLFWSKDERAGSILSLLSEPRPEDVRELLRVPHTGRTGLLDVDASPFYAVALAGSGGRVAVREWMETTLGEAKSSLRAYFERQRIVQPNGDAAQPIGIYRLCTSLFRKSDEIPPGFPVSLVRHATQGSVLPLSTLTESLRRTRTTRAGEQRVPHPIAALIKMTLLSNQLIEEGTMEELDEALRNPGYVCGRIFAIVETAQREALGNVNASVADRYFGAASTSPAYVLGKLVSDARKAHFSKLRRDRPGVFQALSRRLEDVMTHLNAFPETLTLEEQGRFVLGYYHQRAADRAAWKARGRPGDQVPSPDDNDDSEGEAAS